MGCEIHEITNTVFCSHFCFLIKNIARGKKHPVSSFEHIYGSTDFFGSTLKMLSKEANYFDAFKCNIYRDKWFPIVVVMSLKKP